MAICPSALSNLAPAIPDSLASDEDSSAVDNDEGDDEAAGGARRAVSVALPTDSILAVIIV